MGPQKDITGTKFGRLTLVNRIRRNDLFYFECACDCGGTKTVISGAITRSDRPTRSCGCIAKEGRGRGVDNPSYRHGHAVNGKRSKLLRTWSGMFDRCYNNKNKSYEYYGGRGITVSLEWHDFKQFAIDMAGSYEGLSIDRIDNNLGYSKNNCRWATDKEQTRNARSNIMLTFNGEEKNLSSWCEEFGINYWAGMSRYKRGWTIEKILTTPVRAISTGH